jgi:hypothetical protein
VPEAFEEVGAFLADFNRIVHSLEEKTYAFTPIVIAVGLSEQAYLDFDVQLRLLERVMALEALFSSKTYGVHALVPRVPCFLGADMQIYPGTTASYTVAAVLKDLCVLRNDFAHGRAAPRRFLNASPEPPVASDNVKSYADVLREASAVILRSVFLKIFRERLLDVFADKRRMEAFFAW